MVFTQIFCWLIVAIGSCCFLAGCSAYRTVRIETLEPAKFFLERGNRIAFLDRNIFSQVDSAQIALSQKMIAKSFSDGINDGLVSAEPSNTPIILEQIDASGSKDHLPEMLEYQQIVRLCSKFKMDYIVSLENHFLQRKDKKYHYSWLIRLYHYSSFTPVDSCVFENKLSKTKKDELMDELMETSWKTGVKYAERILPYWKESERRVYRNGKALRLGDMFYRSGQLDEAIKVWSAARQISVEEAVRAIFNLAWVHENAGDIEMAAQLLKEAEQLAKGQNIRPKDADYLKEYLKIINLRIENIKLLDNQIKKDSINGQL